jgi:hypothetical protein
MKRRDLLKTAAAVAAPLVIPRHFLSAPGRPGANERIHLAGIGIGGRGSGVLGEFLNQPDVRCVAVCDARANRRARTKSMVDAKDGNQDCAEYPDFRDLLARDDLDAELITTGSNNHALLSIYAARARRPQPPAAGAHHPHPVARGAADRRQVRTATTTGRRGLPSAASYQDCRFSGANFASVP